MHTTSASAASICCLSKVARCGHAVSASVTGGPKGLYICEHQNVHKNNEDYFGEYLRGITSRS